MIDTKGLSRRPLKLKSTRIRRNYRGGLLLEAWQGESGASDGHWPEEWVASTTEARDTRSAPGEGLSIIDLGGTDGPYLRDVIAADPEAFLGAEHVAKYGTDTALLVKIIDAQSRLLLQAHPDKLQAKALFGSDYGKTEAWYIIGGRETREGPPYVLLGFKEHVTRQLWADLFTKQDVAGMIDCLHRFTVSPGEVYFIEGGVPHAIGGGCLVLEVQEPTDYTFRVERKTPDGRPLPDSFCHQGAGFERMLDCFHYDPCTRQEIKDRWLLAPAIISSGPGGMETALISPEQSAYFSMIRLDVTGTYRQRSITSGMAVAVVLSGQGTLAWDGGRMDIGRADELFLPAGIQDMEWRSGGDTLAVVLCRPPQ